MPDKAKEKRPIIVIKKKGGHGGHHGGAWKVAYADFVTAMMSLFIVLWLMSSSDQVKKAIAGYFNDPKGSGTQTGSAAASNGDAITINQQNVTKLQEEIRKAIVQQANLTKLAKQIDITVTGEGLRIDLIEGSGSTFFQSGSPKLSDNGVQLLSVLAAQLKALPNHLLIEGHTDAQPFSSGNGYSNWELSADRANAARRLLQQGGIGENQISQVRGYADQHLRVPTDPLDPSNRRISVVVQWLEPSAAASTPSAGEAKPGDSEAKPGEAKPAGEKGEAKPGGEKSAEAKSPSSEAAKSAEPAPASSEKSSTSTASEAKQPPSPEQKPSSPPASSKPAASTPAKAGIFARLKSLIPGKKS